MTEEQDKLETARALLREKYQAKGALVDTANFRAEDHPVTFSTSLEGLEGTGKSHLIMMTCPTPIVTVNFGDRSSVPFLYNMTKERMAQVHPYDINPPTAAGWDRTAAVESLKELGEIVAAEGPLMKGGTFALDGGSSWWGAVQQVFVAPLEEAQQAAGKKQVGGIIYEQGNLRARGMMSFIKNLGCFFFVTHQLKQDWNAAGPIPFQFSPKRNSQVPYLMECVVRMAKVCATCKAPNCQEATHIGRLHRSRLEKLSGNTGLEGMWVDNLDFKSLYAFQTGKQYPGEIIK